MVLERSHQLLKDAFPSDIQERQYNFKIWMTKTLVCIYTYVCILKHKNVTFVFSFWELRFLFITIIFFRVWFPLLKHYLTPLQCPCLPLIHKQMSPFYKQGFWNSWPVWTWAWEGFCCPIWSHHGPILWLLTWSSTFCSVLDTAGSSGLTASLCQPLTESSALQLWAPELGKNKFWLFTLPS